MHIKFTSHVVLVSMVLSSSGLSAFATDISAHTVNTESSDAPPTSSDENASDEKQVAPGYLMQMSSSQDASLNGTFRIQFDGKIELPYNVTLQTKNMSLEQFQSEINRAYRPYFRNKTNVRVSVKQRRAYVEVRGKVAKPGIFLVKTNAPLDEIISLAGGITEDLTQGYVRIEQGGQTKWVNLSDYFKRGREQNVNWLGGDQVFFQKEGPETPSAPGSGEFSQKVQVLGEVKSPGELTFHRDADAYYYLVKSGGPTSQTDLGKVEVVRTNPKTGAHEPVTLAPVEDVKIVKEGDILLFHPSRTSTGEKILQNAALASGIVSAIVLTIIAIRGVNK